MNKHTVYKSVQLALFVVLAIAVIALVLTDAKLHHQAATDPAVSRLCTALWAVLVLSFIFLFLDFYYFLGYRKDYREMVYALHSDPESGIANRYSCDAVVEKYLDKPLPADMGCIMIDLSNIGTINHTHGHTQGNLVISDFSMILNSAARELCFVGRNGGNKFLALFESTTADKMALFLQRVEEAVKAYNALPGNCCIQYHCGTAFRESAEIDGITKLIALSNTRIYSAVQTGSTEDETESI